MNKEKKIVKSREEILIDKFNLVADKARKHLKARNFIKKDEEIEIKDVIRYREQVELTKKDYEVKETKGFYLYVVKWEYTNPEMQEENSLTELEFLVEENEKGEIVNIPTIEDLVEEYEKESFEKIGVVKENAEENEKLPKKEQNEGLKKDSLEELEKEDSKEKKVDTKDAKTESKKRKPSYIIETINPDVAKMDYWQNIRQAFGLPSQVATLAFAYPVSSEDKVDYANITIYMLDKDGNIIDSLDVDNYFEFDSSTGNNPMQDNVQRNEEDENKGKAQLDKHYTMIRLESKKANNTYISLEQKNGFGDYNDINAGRKVIAGTQNVEKQLETDRVRVWDSERELLMKSNAGMFHINDMYEEAEIHEEHEEYVDLQNADGYMDTKVPCDKHIYTIIECMTRLKEKDYIREHFSDKEIVNKLIETIDKNPDITPNELISKVEEDIVEGSEMVNSEVDEPSKQISDDEEYGPWSKSMGSMRPR